LALTWQLCAAVVDRLVRDVSARDTIIVAAAGNKHLLTLRPGTGLGRPTR
jgi:hypothetical protein